MNLTYDKGRGLHWWECPECKATWPTRIPDQADVETETRPRVWVHPQTVKALGADGHTRLVEVMVPVARGTETVVVDGYQHNPGAPELALCPNCNGGHFPRIRLVSRTPRRWSPNVHVDGGSDPSPDGHLDGEWGQWARIAAQIARRAPFEDRDDLIHSIIVRLAEVKAKYQAKGKPLTEGAMVRTASYVRAKHWAKRIREAGFISLDRPLRNDEGDETDYGRTLVDDQAIDLDKWIDDRTWLAGFPRRLLEIAHKVVNGETLTPAERFYLHKCRKRERRQTRFG